MYFLNFSLKEQLPSFKLVGDHNLNVAFIINKGYIQVLRQQVWGVGGVVYELKC